jgi:hypothetical protein
LQTWRDYLNRIKSNQINHHNAIHQTNDTNCAISMYVSDFSCTSKSRVVIGSMTALMCFFQHKADSRGFCFSLCPFDEVELGLGFDCSQSAPRMNSLMHMNRSNHSFSLRDDCNRRWSIVDCSNSAYCASDYFVT